jgi:MFS family permease
MRLPRSWGSYLIVTTLSAVQGTQLSLVAPFLDGLGYPPSLIGGLVAVTAVVSLLSRLPAGLLYRSDTARRVQGAAIAALAAFIALHPFAVAPWAFLLVRVLSGLVYGVAMTINLARFVDEQPPGPARARAMGYYASGIAVGYSVASLLVGYVVESWGYVAAFAAGAALVLAGVLGLLDATAVVGPAPASSATGGAAPSRTGAVPLASPTTRGGEAAGAGFRALLRAPALLVLALEALLLNAQWSFWNAWLPLYGLAMGISLAEVGVLRTVYGAFNALGRPLSGAVVSRVGASRLAPATLAAQFLLLMLLPALPAFGPLLVLFVVAGVLRAVGIVANTVAVVESSEARGLGRGPMVGLFSTVTDLGLLSGPALGGLVAQVVGPVQVFVYWPALMLVVYGAALGASRLVPRAG